MFDIGWSELVVIAIVAILVVGPKDLPAMLRTIGKTVGNLRRMAGDFQRQFDQALKEAELDEVRKQVKAPFQPLEDARKSAQSFQKQVNDSIRDLEQDSAPAKPEGGPAETAEGVARPAEPANKPAEPAATAKSGSAATGTDG